MTSLNILGNAYTNIPELHPNLLIGSIQLIFWSLFHPSALHNHITRSNLSSSSESTINTLTQNRELLRLLIQGYLILPLPIYLFLALFLLLLVCFGLEYSTNQTPIFIQIIFNFSLLFTVVELLPITLYIAFGLTFGLILSVMFGDTFGKTFSVAFGAVSAIVASCYLLEVVNNGRVSGETVSPFLYGALSAAIGVALSAAIGVRLNGAFSVAFTSIIIAALTNTIFRSTQSIRSSNNINNDIISFVVGIGFTLSWWLPVILYPLQTIWNITLFISDKKEINKSPSFLANHSAFWHEYQLIPLIGLEQHIVFIAERKKNEAKAAIEYLVTSSQSWAAQAAQIEIYACELEDCKNVEDISDVHHSMLALAEAENAVASLFKFFSSISQEINQTLRLTENYNQRIVLIGIGRQLDTQLKKFIISRQKYTSRFYPIAKKWHDIIISYIDELAKETELYQETDSPYIIGIPLTQEQEIFIGRGDIAIRIEQLLLDRRRPPLLLYGQRRMGKTSLLNNLQRLLPNTIIPMFVDLQGAPSSGKDSTGFLYNLARSMRNSAKKQGVILQSLNREMLATDPFTCFDEWLDEVEKALEQNTALLMLDEFEVLDSALQKGRFDEQDILGMLRHLIQHRPRFKVMIAGSHTIEEYQRWASYLINVQVVHISYLKEHEARQLIERPVQDFTLSYEPDAVERVLQLTRCHPCLVQILCAEIVAYKNKQDPSVRRLATLIDVEAVIPASLSSGGFIFADIQNNQVDTLGRDILCYIAVHGEGAIISHESILQQFPDADTSLKLLLQRELIEEVSKDYCFQVELIRRWFACQN